MHRHQHKTTTGGADVIEITARGHAYRFVCTPGDRAALMHAVRAMAEDEREPLDWFDAALVAYELARRAGSGARSAVNAAPPSPKRPSSGPSRHPFRSEH